MRIVVATIMLAGFISAVQAQPGPRPEQAPPMLSDDKPIVVTGIANGARIVEVDFDKVWKNCAECKRALARLDKLAQPYRDELTVAREFSAGPKCNYANASPLVTFNGSSAGQVGGERRKSISSGASELCAARAADQSRRTFEAMSEKYVVPEQGKMLGYMRSFLDQLAPHVQEATEAERVANNASAGLTDAKRTRLSATRLKRIDVTKAVIARLDAKPFTIVLPDPPKPGPASGGYEPPKGKRR